jgi:hypothetical protein
MRSHDTLLARVKTETGLDDDLRERRWSRRRNGFGEVKMLLRPDAGRCLNAKARLDDRFSAHSERGQMAGT